MDTFWSRARRSTNSATTSPRRQLGLFAAVCLILAACGGADASEAVDEGPYEGVELDTPLAKPDVVLTDTEGNPFDLRAQTDGRLTLLYFGYTNCPDICPVHLAQIESVLKRPGMPLNVDVIFVTVDPERDDPASIRRFLDQFSSKFIGLTGTPDELRSAQLAFEVPVAVKEGDEDNYTFGHAGQVFAFAPDGYAYTVYPQGTRQTHWINDIPLLAALTGESTP